jgi:hypothetical protein
MSFKTKLRIIYTLCLILPSFLNAQQSPVEATNHTDQVNFVWTLSQKEMGNNLRLYTGSEYIPNGQHALGYTFFQSDVPLDGSLLYDGAFYDHILLQYDLVAEEIVIRDTINNANIRLVKEKLPAFSISGHTFLWLPAVGDSDITLNPGYYELLYDSACRLIAKHEKKMIYPSTKEEILKYVPSDTYFLRWHNQYILIEGRRALLNVLADKKDQLKKFIRQNKLDFNRDPANAFIQTIHYYTQLKN